MASQGILIAVIIILIFLGVGTATTHYVKQNDFYSDYMNGAWTASEKFCKDSKIDGMLIYITNGKNSSLFHADKKAYIIMHAGNQIIVEKMFSFGVKLHNLLIPTLSRKAVIKLPLIINNDELKDIMPAYMSMHIDPKAGGMKWYDPENTLFAHLFRDNQASAVA
jgi:hypothetical protein